MTLTSVLPLSDHIVYNITNINKKNKRLLHISVSSTLTNLMHFQNHSTRKWQNITLYVIIWCILKGGQSKQGRACEVKDVILSVRWPHSCVCRLCTCTDHHRCRCTDATAVHNKTQSWDRLEACKPFPASPPSSFWPSQSFTGRIPQQ